MKIENFNKAKCFLKSKEYLEQLKDLICLPCPSFFIYNRIFFGDNRREQISFYSFDEQTQKELKEAIENVISKRIREIDKEIENL